jgi:hypothetical protein
MAWVIIGRMPKSKGLKIVLVLDSRVFGSGTKVNYLAFDD